MRPRTAQLQIRVSPGQKLALKRLARSAGQSVSAYVLARALPEPRLRLGEVARTLHREGDPRHALAELNDVLSGLVPSEFADALAAPPPGLEGLSPLLQNYVTAMVEQACARHALPAPAWVNDVPPLEEPYFAAGLRRLRMHLLLASPVPFKRRNLFVDATVGDRV